MLADGKQANESQASGHELDGRGLRVAYALLRPLGLQEGRTWTQGGNVRQGTAWAENGQLEDCVGGDCSIGSGTEAAADSREGLDVSCARENIALKQEVSLALPARAPC